MGGSLGACCGMRAGSGVRPPSPRSPPTHKNLQARIGKIKGKPKLASLVNILEAMGMGELADAARAQLAVLE